MGTPLQLYLALYHSRDLPANRLTLLIRHFGTVENLLKASDTDLLRWEVSAYQLARWANKDYSPAQARLIDRDLNWSTQATHELISFQDPRYPPLLREIDHPPPILYVIGNPDCLCLPQVAIVGSRKASSSGRKNAYWMAQQLASAGVAVTSGMAAGIDSQAHLGALAQGGHTLAIMGTGADQVYPRHNRDLARNITEQGALVTEFPLGSAPIAANFPRRNRIISGMSLGVLVVEAGLRSGTLITARLAMEQGREVFAIPGAISNPLSKGCHQLLREGAKLVESCEDILEELRDQFDRNLWMPEDRPAIQQSSAGKAGKIPSHEKRILEILSYDRWHFDSLQQQLELPGPLLSASLLSLEAKGLIVSSGGRYARLD